MINHGKIKSNPKSTQQKLAKEIGFSDSTINRYGIEI